MIRGIVEGSEYLVAEPRIKLRRLERKRIEPDRVTADLDRAPLGPSQQFAADAAAAQLGMDPKIGDEQAAGVDRPDKPGHDLAALASDKKADPGESRLAEKVAIVNVESVADRVAVRLRRPILETQPISWGQVHRSPPVAALICANVREDITRARKFPAVAKVVMDELEIARLASAGQR
jgi:hypothetical protein